MSDSALDEICARVTGFIRDPQPAGFASLALEVFRFQYKEVGAYRQFCIERGIAAPAQVRSLDEIPAASTLAFKFAELKIDGLEQFDATFVTSGTTRGGERRGRHYLPRINVYRESALAHLGRMVFADRIRLRILALHPTAERAPQSSLGRMISFAIEEFGGDRNLCAADALGVDVHRALEFLSEAIRDNAPVAVMATTAACASLFDAIRSRAGMLRLPPASRLMDTGGAKGQLEPLTPEQLIESASQLLGIEPALVINEYGMTELCSQLYDATPFNSAASNTFTTRERVKIAPPWLHVRTVNPINLQALSLGTPGLLAFFDLANVGSVSAILTEDFGVVEQGSVRIFGRATAAEARGCALGIEQFAGRA